MNRDTIRFTIPLPLAWTEEEDPLARVDVILTPVDGANLFKVTPIGTVAVANQTSSYSQVYWELNDTVNVEVIWWFNTTSQLTSVSSEILGTSIEAQLELGQIVSPEGNSDKWDILLRGSLSIVLNSSNIEWQKLLAQLWPTGDSFDITNLRIEPAGLFLQGKLPAEFFPNNKQGSDVVLRVPQKKLDKWDLKTQQVNKFLRNENNLVSSSLQGKGEEKKQRVWTLSTFTFPGLINANKFIEEQANKFKEFKTTISGNEVKFLDNVVFEPDSNCMVSLAVTIDGTSRVIDWWASKIGIRLMISGADSTDEVAFFPEFLVGSLTLSDGTWQRSPIAFVSGQPDNVQNKIPEDLIRLDADPSKCQLEFNKRELAAYVIPSTTLQDQSGNLKTSENKELIRRAWLSTETGWLSLDAIQSQAKIQDKSPSETVSGVFAIDKLVSIFSPEGIADEVLSGMSVQVEALKESHVAIILSPVQNILSLWLAQTKTILKTPVVWYYANRNQGSIEKSNPREEEPILETLVPSLTAALIDVQNDNSEKQLRDNLEKQLKENILFSAIFLSKNALSDKDDTFLDDIPQRLLPSIEWNQDDKQFIFEFNSNGVQLWHYFEGCPLVQETPFSPTVSRDQFLDANRGLIPYTSTSKDTPVKICFASKRLPYLLEQAPPVPTDLGVSNSKWLVNPIIADRRFFLPTLPGVDLQIKKSAFNFAISTWQWSYRHAVPVLDEAYREITEVVPENQDSLKIPVELTRIQGTTAFTIKKGEDLAKGWLHPTISNPPGEARINISDINFLGLQPQIKFTLLGLADANGTDRNIVFQRPRFNDAETVAALTAKLKATVNPNQNGGLPTFQVGWSNDNDPTSLEIVNNGQPLISRWNEPLQRVITLDGEGFVQEEPIGPDRREKKLDQPTVTFRTASYLLINTIGGTSSENTKLQLDIAGIPVVSSINPQPEAGQWMLHDGAGTWPIWRGFPLMPLRLEEFSEDNNVITIRLVVILLWRTPKTVSEVSSESTGEITLTFSGVGNTLELTGLKGVIDWRFPGLTEDKENVYLKRLKVIVDQSDFSIASLPLKLQEIDVDHPIGLLRLRPDLDSSNCALNNGGINFNAKRTTSFFEYEVSVKITTDKLTEEVTKLTGEFKWLGQGEDNISWHLNHQFTKLDPLWSIELKRELIDLIGVTKLKPNHISTRQFLFEILPSKDIDENSPPKLPDNSWFKINQVEGGFIGVEFGLPKNAGEPEAPELVVVNIAGDLQLLFGDSDARTNDAIHIYDPVTDELQTIDRDTGDICDPVSLPGFSVAVIQEQIFWATKDSKLKRWNLQTNKADSKVDIDGLDIPLPGIPGEIVQSLSVIDQDQSIVVFVNESNEIYCWDLNDYTPSPTPNGLRNPIDKPVLATDALEVVADKISVLVSSQRQGGIRLVWSREQKLNESRRLYFWKPFANGSIENPKPFSAQPISPHSSDIIAVDFLPTENGPIVSGDTFGKMFVWQPNDGSTYQTMQLTDVKITALVVVGNDFIVSGDSNGQVTLWPQPSRNLISKLILNEIAEPNDQYKILAEGNKEDNSVKSLVVLESNSTSTIYSIAILTNKGKVIILTIKKGKFVVLDKKELAASSGDFPRFLDLRETTAKAISWRIKNSKFQLVVTGDRVGTRLSGLIKLRKAGEDKKLNVSFTGTGWLVLDNDIRFNEKIQTSNGTVIRQCTHKINFFIDSAPLTIEAIYNGIGPDTDLFISGVSEHTLRLGAGKDNKNPTQQIEHIWQAAQVLRFTTRSRFNQTFLPPAISSDDNKLVLEAGAVFWMQQIPPSQNGGFGGGSEIANSSLSILLRSQQTGQFQSSLTQNSAQDIVGTAHVVRLPFAAAPTSSSVDSPLATITIPDRPAPKDSELLHLTSGVQPLSQSPPERKLGQIEYFQRTTQPRFTTVSKRPLAATLDALWLGSIFLNDILFPKSIDKPENPILGQVSPIFGDKLIPDQLDDLVWLRPPQPIPLTLNASSSALNPGNAFTKRLKPILVAGTLTRQYFPDQGLQSLLGMALFEFPFQVLGSSKTQPSEPEVHDVQLIEFDKGELFLLATERLAGSDDVLQKWAKSIAQRRTQGRFILVDFSRVLLVPLDTEATQEELRYAHPWAGTLPPIDVRSRFPRLIPSKDENQRVLLQTTPNLNLLVFDAYPVKPLSVYPGVAATRYRMTSTASIGTWQLTQDSILDWKALAEAINLSSSSSSGESFLANLKNAIDPPQNLSVTALKISEQKCNEIINESNSNASQSEIQPNTLEISSVLQDVIDNPTDSGKQKIFLSKLNQRLAGFSLHNNDEDFPPLEKLIAELGLETNDSYQPFLNRRLLEIAINNFQKPLLNRQLLEFAAKVIIAPFEKDKKHTGNLRPARMETITLNKQKYVGGFLGYTVREDLPFEKTESKLYPYPNARPLTERPIVTPDQPLTLRSLFPPLMDVVSWSARPGEMSRVTWNLDRTYINDGTNKTVWLGSSNGASVNLRRPRAIAGENQSVRLSSSLGKPSIPIFGDRFLYAPLLLTQVIDRTDLTRLSEPDNGVYAFLVTKNELFQGATSFERASQIPAVIYKSASDLELFEIYLIVDTSVFKTDSNSDKILLLWTKDPIVKDKLPEENSPEIIQKIDNINSPLTDNVWEQIDDTTIWKLRISFPALKKFLTIQQNKDVKEINLALIQYRQTSENPPVFEADKIWAIIKINILDTEGRLRSPKMSVSVLAYPQNNSLGNEPAILAGYGRLGDDDLSPIRPVAAANFPTSQTIEWLRTAGLQVLHRVPEAFQSKKIHYDAVVYGAGGEVLPTESTTEPPLTFLGKPIKPSKTK